MPRKSKKEILSLGFCCFLCFELFLITLAGTPRIMIMGIIDTIHTFHNYEFAVLVERSFNAPNGRNVALAFFKENLGNSSSM